MSLLRCLLLVWVWIAGLIQFAQAQAPDAKVYLHTECEGDPLCFPSNKSKPDFGGLEIREADGNFGVRDEKGEVVIPFVYDRIFKDRYRPLFAAKKDGETVWLDLDGNTVAEDVALAPTPEKRRDYLGCGHGVFVFEKDGLFGLKFETERVLVEPKYYALTCYRNGVAWGALKDIRLWCPIDPEGVVHVGPKCREDVATMFPKGYGYQKMSGSGLFESTTSWNRAFRWFGLGKRVGSAGFNSQPTF